MNKTVTAGASLSRPYMILGATVLLVALLFESHGLTVRASDVEAVAIPFGFLMLLGRLLQLRGWVRSGACLEHLSLFLTLSLSFLFVGIGIAANSQPLADIALARWDQDAFPWFDWPKMMKQLAATDTWVMRVLNLAYASMGVQALGAVFVSCLLRSRDRSVNFMTSWTVALAITMVIHHFLPAMGAYSHFGILHREVPAIHAQVGWTQPDILQNLRTGAISTVDWGTLEGLISFPSFHAAAGVLLVRFFWPFGALRWPAFVLNTAMILAAVPCGGHYFVDIIAGLFVGLLALALLHVPTAILINRMPALSAGRTWVSDWATWGEKKPTRPSRKSGSGD